MCALGFEPNPTHQQKLKKIEKKYQEYGWKVHFFFFAISDEDKNVSFYTQNNSKDEDDGASLLNIKRHFQPYTVRAVSLSEFLIKYLKGKQIKLMKMDIEGAEYEVLTDLLFKKTVV